MPIVIDEETRILAETLQAVKSIKSEAARRDLLNIAKGIVIGETPLPQEVTKNAPASENHGTASA